MRSDSERWFTLRNIFNFIQFPGCPEGSKYGRDLHDQDDNGANEDIGARFRNQPRDDESRNSQDDRREHNVVRNFEDQAQNLTSKEYGKKVKRVSRKIANEVRCFASIAPQFVILCQRSNMLEHGGVLGSQLLNEPFLVEPDPTTEIAF